MRMGTVTIFAFSVKSSSRKVSFSVRAAMSPVNPAVAIGRPSFYNKSIKFMIYSQQLVIPIDVYMRPRWRHGALSRDFLA